MEVKDIRIAKYSNLIGLENIQMIRSMTKNNEILHMMLLSELHYCLCYDSFVSQWHLSTARVPTSCILKTEPNDYFIRGVWMLYLWTV